MHIGTLPDDVQSISWVIVGFFSAWGGLVRYLMDIRPGKQRWRWMAVLSQVVISCFTGFIGGLYSYEMNSSPTMTLVIAGVCSTLGSTLLRRLWQRFWPGQA
ncbi:phage holin family protein [Lelliottia nimipressuralis]|uniref:phage holin family protein n=1 Tax=Lelliottia nimipressuralis TaxID=69220 RepID=UPI001E504650|nr:phage holin family protein [Lelliottia nimipressuralis]MCD4562236.1 phage holin family protein [Lelliottia nimipressuralis]